MIAAPARRAAAALVTLVAFATTIVAEARGLDPCPHHDGVAPAGEPAGHESHGTADAMGHAHAGAETSASPRPATREHARHGPCTCLGCGTAVGSPAGPLRSIVRPDTVELPPFHSFLARSRSADAGWWVPYLPHAPPRGR